MSFTEVGLMNGECQVASVGKADGMIV